MSVSYYWGVILDRNEVNIDKFKKCNSDYDEDDDLGGAIRFWYKDAESNVEIIEIVDDFMTSFYDKTLNSQYGMMYSFYLIGICLGYSDTTFFAGCTIPKEHDISQKLKDDVKLFLEANNFISKVPGICITIDSKK